MIDFSKAVDLSKVGQNKDKDINGMVHAKDLDLLPSEENAIYQAVVDERYGQESVNAFHAIETTDDLKRAVQGFARRLVARIADVGFKAVVSADLMDTDNFDMYGDEDHPTIEWHPRVDITGRIDDNGKSEDHDRRAYEIRTGQADGKVGRITENGEWSEDPYSKKVIS